MESISVRSMAAGLVDEVDRLVRQEAVGDVAVREHRRRHQGVVLDAHAVVHLEALAQAAEDRDRVLDGRRIDGHRLEAALQGRVLLDVLAVLVERGGADAVQLAAREHGLEQVARVRRALGLAGADDGVELVDEEQDAPLALLDLVEHGLQALLELAAVLGAGEQRAHVEREDGAVLEPLGHVAAHDALGQAFDDGGLAHARLADQHGVVLGLARQDADHPPDLGVAADHRIELVAPRLGHEIDAVLLQRLVGRPPAWRWSPAGCRARPSGRRGSASRVTLKLREEPAERRGGALVDHGEQQVLDGDVLVLEALGLVLGPHQDLLQPLGEIDLPRLDAGAGDLGPARELALDLGLQRPRSAPPYGRAGGERAPPAARAGRGEDARRRPPGGRSAAPWSGRSGAPPGISGSV